MSLIPPIPRSLAAGSLIDTGFRMTQGVKNRLGHCIRCIYSRYRGRGDRGKPGFALSSIFVRAWASGMEEGYFGGLRSIPLFSVPAPDPAWAERCARCPYRERSNVITTKNLRGIRFGISFENFIDFPLKFSRLAKPSFPALPSVSSLI